MNKLRIIGALLFALVIQVDARALNEIPLEDSKFMYSTYSKRISMDFKDAALSEILKIFSQQSGLNFIAASDVTSKRVTLFFENIPVEEALDKILTANGLSYETQPGSDIFVVKAQTDSSQNMITRVYQLKNATVTSSKMNKSLKIKPAGDEDSSGGGGDSSSSSSSSSSSASGPTPGIVSAVQAVMTSNGKMTEDPRTNSLIITDAEKQFPVIEETIKRLDVPVPQIFIQVEMMDVLKGTTDKLGIRYSDTVMSLTGAQRQVLYPWDLHVLKSKGFTFGDDPPEYTPGSLNTSSMEAVVQFLKTQSDTRNLARPRLLTLNNETAEIKISTNEAIGKETQTNSTGGSTATTSVEAERVETGVFLLVTPQANVETDEITLAVAPRVIQARRSVEFAEFKDPEERGSKQFMKVKSGDTIVIGGLMRTDYSNAITKLPLLGDIPIIGRAFRHKDQAKSERELLIFITPSIVSEQNKEKLLAKDKNKDYGFGIDGEQEVPKSRQNQINKELSSIENQRF